MRIDMLLLVVTLYLYTQNPICLIAQIKDGEQVAMYLPVLDTISSSVTEEIECARAAFHYTKNAYEYDLGAEVESIRLEKGGLEEGVPMAAATVARLVGIPLRQEASREVKVVEMAIKRPADSTVPRRMWTQMFATFEQSDSFDSYEQWPLDSGAQPDTLTIWRDGRTYSYYTAKKKGYWTSVEQLQGIALVPPFEQFGNPKQYLGDDKLQKDSVWDLDITIPEVGLMLCVWERHDLMLKREVGILVSDTHPYKVHRSWRGFAGENTHESDYLDFSEVSPGVFYPRKTVIRKFVPLDDRVILASEEIYELIGSSVVLSCEFDHGIFDPQEKSSAKDCKLPRQEDHLEVEFSMMALSLRAAGDMSPSAP